MAVVGDINTLRYHVVTSFTRENLVCISKGNRVGKEFMTEEQSLHHAEDNFVGAKFRALPVDPVNTGFVKELSSAHAELKIITGR